MDHWGAVSVCFEDCELLGMFYAFKQALTILQMDGVILNARVKSALEAVFAQVVVRQHAESLMVLVAFFNP